MSVGLKLDKWLSERSISCTFWVLNLLNIYRNTPPSVPQFINLIFWRDALLFNTSHNKSISLEFSIETLYKRKVSSLVFSLTQLEIKSRYLTPSVWIGLNSNRWKWVCFSAFSSHSRTCNTGNFFNFDQNLVVRWCREIVVSWPHDISWQPHDKLTTMLTTPHDKLTYMVTTPPDKLTTLSFILPGNYRVITLFLPGISDLGQRQVKFPYPWKITLFSDLHSHTPLTLWDIPTTYRIVTEITNEDMNNSTTIWIAGSRIIIVSQKVYSGVLQRQSVPP